jgi:hypothetical protein
MDKYFDIPAEESKYLLEVVFADDCIFIIDTLNENDKDSWEVIMPGGIQIKCPHGLIFNSDQELSEDE